ncbi:helix-turn-helix domain-containing protein [Streptomyces sp. Edi2]|uniref:helix-turn-helix domain-containing protein n=1 Tax=Streptomyces sp. Edi2 TaxID=3162528 RepID=UPI0033058826
MNRTPDRTTRSRPGAEPAELATLRGWLRAAKGNLTFYSLARRARGDGRPDYTVSECTLRQALDGRLPTLRTILAFARGAGADQKKAERLWRRADRAVNPPPRRPAPHVPGSFTTPAGLVRAMNRVRTTAPHTSLRALADQAGPALTRSTLHRILTGQQIPTAGQLAAFAAACDAGEAATAALLAGHHRILNGPPLPMPYYGCAYAEVAEERRLRDETARPWLAEPERDWYDQQLHDEREADHQRQIDEAEALLDELEAEPHPAPAGPSPADSSLRAELAAIARAQPVYDTRIGRPPAPAGPNPEQSLNPRPDASGAAPGTGPGRQPA